MNVSYFLIGSLICLGSIGLGAVAYEPCAMPRAPCWAALMC